MNESTSTAAPKWFLPVAIIALIWNLMGLAAFFMYVTLDQAGMDAAGWNEEQQALFKTTPVWTNIAFGVAVVTGVLGTFALLMRRKLATVVLWISLVAVLAQCTWIYFLSDAVRIMGVGLSPVTITVSIALVVLSHYAAKRGWLK